MSAGRVSYPEFQREAAETYAAMVAFSRSAVAFGVDKGLTELVKVRVSQINGCAFCVAYHLKLARGLDVEAAKLDMLAVWREAVSFTPAERAALAWAEDMANMPNDLPSLDTHKTLQQHFDHRQIIGLNIALANINAWNRMAVAFGFSPADA